MKATVELDEALTAQVQTAGALIHQDPDTVLRLAIEAGLPLLVRNIEPVRPEGYFSSDYPLPDDWTELEIAMAKAPQRLDR